jgi:hypothetical protein
MTESQALEAICNRFATQWPIVQPTVPFTLENERLDAPDRWLRVTVQFTSRVQASQNTVGNRRFDSRGNIFVQLFGPVDAGAKGLSDLVQDVRTTFESQSIASGGEAVVTYAASRTGNDTDGRWFMSGIVIPFEFHETR